MELSEFGVVWSYMNLVNAQLRRLKCSISPAKGAQLERYIHLELDKIRLLFVEVGEGLADTIMLSSWHQFE